MNILTSVVILSTVLSSPCSGFSFVNGQVENFALVFQTLIQFSLATCQTTMVFEKKNKNLSFICHQDQKFCISPNGTEEFAKGCRLFFPCCTRREKWEKFGKNRPKIGQKSNKKKFQWKMLFICSENPGKIFPIFPKLHLQKESATNKRRWN